MNSQQKQDRWGIVKGTILVNKSDEQEKVVELSNHVEFEKRALILQRRKRLNSLSDKQLRKLIDNQLDSLVPHPSNIPPKPDQPKTIGRSVLLAVANYIDGWVEAMRR